MRTIIILADLLEIFNLNSLADKVYSFHYYTAKKPNREQDFIVHVGKTKVCLYSLLKTDSPSYTRIVEEK